MWYLKVLFHQVVIVFIPKVSKHNPLPLNLVCCSKSYPSRHKTRVFTLLSHVCTGPEGSKHKTIKHYQSDRFAIPGKKAGRIHQEILNTLKTGGNFSPSHPPWLHSHLLTGPLTSWDELIFFYLSAHSRFDFHPPPLSSSLHLFLLHLSQEPCLVHFMGLGMSTCYYTNQSSQINSRTLFWSVLRKDVCWPGWEGCVHQSNSVYVTCTFLSVAAFPLYAIFGFLMSYKCGEKAVVVSKRQLCFTFLPLFHTTSHVLIFPCHAEDSLYLWRWDTCMTIWQTHFWGAHFDRAQRVCCPTPRTAWRTVHQ